MSFDHLVCSAHLCTTPFTHLLVSRTSHCFYGNNINNSTGTYFESDVNDKATNLETGIHEFKTEMKADMRGMKAEIKEIKEEVKEWKELHDDLLDDFAELDEAFDHIYNFTFQRIDGIRNDHLQRLDTFKTEILAAIAQSQKDLILAENKSEELKNDCEYQETATDTQNVQEERKTGEPSGDGTS